MRSRPRSSPSCLRPTTTDGALSVLSAERVAPLRRLAVDATGVKGKEGGPQLRLKGLHICAEHFPRADRGRVEVTHDFIDRPCVRHDEGVARNLKKPALTEH